MEVDVAGLLMGINIAPEVIDLPQITRISYSSLFFILSIHSTQLLPAQLNIRHSVEAIGVILEILNYYLMQKLSTQLLAKNGFI